MHESVREVEVHAVAVGRAAVARVLAHGHARAGVRRVLASAPVRAAWRIRRAWWFTATSRTKARFARTFSSILQNTLLIHQWGLGLTYPGGVRAGQGCTHHRWVGNVSAPFEANRSARRQPLLALHGHRFGPLDRASTALQGLGDYIAAPGRQ